MAEDRERASLRRLRRIRREADQRASTTRPDRGVPRRAGGLMDIPVTVLAVDDQPANLRLLDAVLTPRGHRVLTASSGAEALAVARDRGRRPRPARHRDAGDGRPRSLPEDPIHARDGIPSGRDDHRQRKRTAAGRARVGCRRLHHQAVRPERAAGPGGVAGAHQALPRHHPTAGRRADRMEHRARDAGRPAGGRVGAHQPAYAASCRHNWPIWSSATRACSRAIAARSSSSSPI